MHGDPITRARFLKLLAACGAGVGVGRSWAAPDEAPAATDSDALVREALVVDGLFSPRRRADSSWPTHAGEIKRLTGIDAGFWDVDDLTNLENVAPLVEAYASAVVKVDRTDDVGLARASGRVGLIYYASRCPDLAGSLAPLSRWRELGLRALQLTREGDNAIGGGFDRDRAPLTAFGRTVVKELNRLKLLIDVSHCGKRTTLDVASASTAPVAALHANPSALAPHDRNKSDEEIRAIARSGGVVAPTTLARYLRPAPEGPASIREFVEQIDHVVQGVGIDHAAVASDTWIDGEPLYAYDLAGDALSGYGRWFSVAAALTGRGYSAGDVRQVLGLNLLRVLRQTIG